ncbi:hypothetical protein ScPMuIL_006969 [Solemya velum]
MAVNTGKLAGRTLFHHWCQSGDWESHRPKAARDVESVGGKCLPCVVDIRHEDQVQKAIDAAVDKFGGIDILVNNASAISLTGTLDTPMKKYDLMMNINGGGPTSVPGYVFHIY